MHATKVCIAGEHRAAEHRVHIDPAAAKAHAAEKAYGFQAGALLARVGEDTLRNMRTIEPDLVMERGAAQIEIAVDAQVVAVDEGGGARIVRCRRVELAAAQVEIEVRVRGTQQDAAAERRIVEARRTLERRAREVGAALDLAREQRDFAREDGEAPGQVAGDDGVLEADRHVALALVRLQKVVQPARLDGSRRGGVVGREGEALAVTNAPSLLGLAPGAHAAALSSR